MHFFKLFLYFFNPCHLRTTANMLSNIFIYYYFAIKKFRLPNTSYTFLCSKRKFLITFRIICELILAYFDRAINHRFVIEMHAKIEIISEIVAKDFFFTSNHS